MGSGGVGEGSWRNADSPGDEGSFAHQNSCPAVFQDNSKWLPCVKMAGNTNCGPFWHLQLCSNVYSGK